MSKKEDIGDHTEGSKESVRLTFGYAVEVFWGVCVAYVSGATGEIL